ncbi:DJ-1/PfpI family protein [Sphingomonas sp.]|jgi:cyclohexyl-isocyanide hydratase|uniref:DJ-1/PfpI family protein n=1 Tax=Sphingomonas sp. TaxID=28214 RepID=UPI002E34EFD1|nr:DJ-1/PfpI family protein [Sphingomonas sp.]HEX4694284.1 DJ-1/PfpI family protein [Sphingomonas sp.]
MASIPAIHIGFVLFPDMTQLDFTGPAQVLTRMGNTSIELVAKSLDPIATDAGFTLQPTATFATARVPDILFVPGGFGVVPAMEDAETVDWVRRMGAQAEWVTAVCTGALLLGAAGLLDGYRATTHWASHHNLALFGAIPVHERVVFDRNRVTGGGVTAGIDFGLALVAAIRGEDHAKFVQLSIEYDPAPPFDAGSPDKVEPEILDRYRKMVARMASDRDARTRAVADKLSLS